MIKENLEELLKLFMNNKQNLKNKKLTLTIVDPNNFIFTDNPNYYLELKKIKILKKEWKNHKFLILKDWFFTKKKNNISIVINKYKLSNEKNIRPIKLNNNSNNWFLDYNIKQIKKKNILKVWSFREIISHLPVNFSNIKLIKRINTIKGFNYYIPETKELFTAKEKEELLKLGDSNPKFSNFSKSTLFSEKWVSLSKDEFFEGLNWNLVDIENLFISKNIIKKLQ